MVWAKGGVYGALEMKVTVVKLILIRRLKGSTGWGAEKLRGELQTLKFSMRVS